MEGARTPECDEAHTWVSLLLDDTLPATDEGALMAHLATCVTCADFARDLDVLTSTIRAAPLQQPTSQAGGPRAL